MEGDRIEGDDGRTAPRPSLRGRGPLLFARSLSDSSLNEGSSSLSFFLSFLSLFVFLPPPYKFAGARLLSDATAALYLWTDTLPLLPLLFVFTDDVGDGVERSFFRLGTPLRGESRDQEGDGRGPTTAARARLQLHSKFFPRSITNGSFQQGTIRCLPPSLSIPQISFPCWMMGRTLP